jgi:hypothetical protein
MKRSNYYYNYMTRSTFVFATFLLGLLTAACNHKRNIRDFYYPVESLRTGTVYAYESTQNGTTAPEYWYYRSASPDSGQFMSAIYYDSRLQIGQITREKIVDNGALARDYILNEPDSALQRPVQTRALIESGNNFPFQVHDSTGVFLFSLKYHPARDPQATIYLIRNRRFLGDGPSYTFQGKQYPCIRFGVQEAIGNEKEGASEVEGKGEEWYAKGLGLVYSKKVYGRGSLKLETRLVDTFGLAELKKRAGQE